MRLVAVQTGLSPHSVLGGTITDREFLVKLADRGVEVHILTEAGEAAVEHAGFVHHAWRPTIRRCLSPVVHAIPYAGNIDVARSLRRLLAEIGPVDWIRFNSPYAVGLGALMGCRGRRLWASYLHLEDRPAWRVIDSWLPARCDLITCLCEDTRADLVARCPATDTWRNLVVPIGIDVAPLLNGHSSREEVRASLGFSPDDVVLLFVGVLIPRKGVSDLVAAWKQIRGDRRLRLLIIGRPLAPYESSLVRELAAADSQVRYIETVPYEKRGAWFRAADVFAFPTHLEGFGIVVGEAMACGLPVATTRAKGVRSVVVENQTALVTDVGRPQAYAEALHTLAADPALRQKLGEAGRQRILTQFQWEQIMPQLMKALST
jgi:glycosyltransferase involved in cell wall biosynthesis